MVRQIRKLDLLQNLESRFLLLVYLKLLGIDVSNLLGFVFKLPLKRHFLIAFDETLLSEETGDGHVLALAGNERRQLGLDIYLSARRCK